MAPDLKRAATTSLAAFLLTSAAVLVPWRPATPAETGPRTTHETVLASADVQPSAQFRAVLLARS